MSPAPHGSGGGPARIRDFEPLFVINDRKVGIDGFEVITKENRRPHVTRGDFMPREMSAKNPLRRYTSPISNTLIPVLIHLVIMSTLRQPAPYVSM